MHVRIEEEQLAASALGRGHPAEGVQARVPEWRRKQHDALVEGAEPQRLDGCQLARGQGRLECDRFALEDAQREGDQRQVCSELSLLRWATTVVNYARDDRPGRAVRNVLHTAVVEDGHTRAQRRHEAGVAAWKEAVVAAHLWEAHARARAGQSKRE